jgi:hypothetical protein
MEHLIKKNETEIQNTMQGHSSRLEQAKDRISELEDKIHLKEKLKNYYSNNSETVKRICKTSPNHEKNKFEIHGH